MGRLSGRVAIVTGAAQGLGATYAVAMAREGAKVTIADVADCAGAAERVRAETPNAEVLTFKADVSRATDCEAMMAKTVERFGRLDVLVNNAALSGTLKNQPFETIDEAEWDRVMAVNAKGPWLCSKAAAPIMRKQKYGKIINISSGMAFKGVPMMMHYVASKGAILAMTRVLSRELGDDGICVNTIAPGLTFSETIAEKHKTERAFHEVSRLSRAFKREQMPEDLVGAVIFLASAESDFMTGQCMVVDGGSVTN
jgi:NAD(P)-dependent dehydrogenase (short-subunit alcohol dehydrogenase family)